MPSKDDILAELAEENVSPEHTVANTDPVPGPSKPPSARQVLTAPESTPPSSSNVALNGDEDETEAIPCPICTKLFSAADNDALNEHIDFCLSKETIKEASASACPLGGSDETPKPSSKRKWSAGGVEKTQKGKRRGKR